MNWHNSLGDSEHAELSPQGQQQAVPLLTFSEAQDIAVARWDKFIHLERRAVLLAFLCA